MLVNIKRIYEMPASEDGVRILVDRVWPRGISKEKAALDYWLKEVAPSSELRKWFAHDPEKFEAFKEKYKAELTSGKQQQALEKLQAIIKKANKRVTLLYGAKDQTHNQAVVLKEILDSE
ncbi:MAG TPA: DUF488 domain-containing protein [Bacillota bacterium]|nr:DUF488 domain-containing protein [Bacillota bacterium]